MSKRRRIVMNFFAISLVLLGCQGGGQSGGADTGLARESNAGARAYYYFTAAQLILKQGNINEAIWHLKQAITHNGTSALLKLELANLYLVKKESGQALDLVTKVLGKDPGHVEALLVAGRIYQQQKQTSKAIEIYEKVLGSQPTDPGVYLILGRMYWNNENLVDAERVFERMTVNISDSYAAFFFYGKALAAQQKLAQAEKAMLKSIVLEPSLEEPRFELIKIYQSQNRLDKIPAIYQAILTYDPANHNAALGLAEHYHRIKKNSKASEILKGLGLRTENDAAIVSTLFDRYLETKQYADAVWVIKGMLKTAPENSDLHYMRGVAFNGLEQDKNALVHMLKVSPESRFHTNAVVHSAMIFHDQGKIDRAIDVVKKAIVHKPEYIDFYLYLGSFYEEMERYDEALAALRTGLSKDDKNGRIHFRMGVVYDKMGHKQKSIASMKKVLELTPNDAEALNYLGYTYADLGINLDEAETLIQTALRIKPDDGYITDSLGWVYYKRGNYGQALEWLSKAVKLIPDDPIILEHLGDVYLKMDSKDKALIYYKRSLKKKTDGIGPLENKIRAITHP